MMDGFLLNHGAISEVRALLSACNSDVHYDQLGMLLDDWCAEIEDMRLYEVIKPFVGHHMPSERRADMRWEATKEIDEVPQPWGREHEWSDQEGARYERYLIACEAAEDRADVEWRKSMGDMLRAVEGVLS